MVMAAVIALTIDITFILKAQISNLKGVSQKLRQARISVNQYSDNSAYVQKLKADFENLKNKNGGIEEGIFSDSDIPFILDDISQKAAKTGVKIMQIKTQSVSSSVQAPSEAIAGLSLSPLFIRMQLSAGYHQLGGLISRIEENPLFSVAELKISASNTELTKHNVELTIKAYVNKK